MNAFKNTFIFSFLDMMFNMLVAFVALFVLSTLMVNQSASGKVDPKTLVMVTLTWPDESTSDLDVWMRGPDGQIVGYPTKEVGYSHLDRDDIGNSNDTYYVNGQAVFVKKNLETITIDAVVPGEFAISAHYYGPYNGPPETAQVDVIQIDPYKIVYTGKVSLIPTEEKSVVSFLMTPAGDVTDVNTNVSILVRKIYKGG